MMIIIVIDDPDVLCHRKEKGKGNHRGGGRGTDIGAIQIGMTMMMTGCVPDCPGMMDWVMIIVPHDGPSRGRGAPLANIAVVLVTITGDGVVQLHYVDRHDVPERHRRQAQGATGSTSITDER